VQEYHIRDVCRLLKVKKHIIRYWEQEIPFLAPRKDMYRNRIYTLHDINLLYRIKYLLTRKHYTLSKASEKLWREITSENQDHRIKIYELRSKLLMIYVEVERVQKVLKKPFDGEGKNDDNK